MSKRQRETSAHEDAGYQGYDQEPIRGERDDERDDGEQETDKRDEEVPSHRALKTGHVGTRLVDAAHFLLLSSF